MNTKTGTRTAAMLALAGAAALAGCAGISADAPLPHYLCEHDIAFTVRFIDDTAVLQGTRGNDVLLRDAGGQTEQQKVYSNPRMRAEFGLGATGREALLSYPPLPLVARCVRD